MNYPLISEYIKAIKSAEDNFQELTNLRPVLGDDGQPVMTSGNFAVVFKMQDIETDKIYALKCFTKEQEGRAETYNQIADALKNVDSPYLVSLHYLDKELFVDTDQTADAEFPVLLMDWVDGKTLDKYLRENLDDKYALEMLAYRFSQLAQWLIPQPFAHGDLKPDNILVREDGTLILVDYDGMYVPDMECQKARELGSPDFRHPQRTENDFDEHIDDFPLISILLSLKAISLNPNFVEKYGASDRLLFSVSDYIDIAESEILKAILAIGESELNRLYALFILIYGNIDAHENLYLFNIEEPDLYKYTEVTDEDLKESWIDEYGVTYSKDGTKLLRGVSIINYKIREGTIYICDSAFDDWHINKEKHNKKLTLFDEPEEIEDDCLREIYMPDSVRIIGDSAFANCEKLENVHFSNSLSIICDSAFAGCESIQKLTLPKSVFIIGKEAFSCCRGLKKLILPQNLKTIKFETFSSCEKLKSIDLPSNLIEIENNAFEDCSSLTHIDIPSSVESIGNMAFSDCRRLRLLIPPTVKIIEGNLGCKYSISEESPYLHFEDGVLYNKEKTAIYSFECKYDYEGGKLIGKKPQWIKWDWGKREEFSEDEYNQVWSSWKTIDVVDVEIPDNIDTIGNYAFWCVSFIRSVVIPASVKHIGFHAFYNCEQLVWIHLPGNLCTPEIVESLDNDIEIIIPKGFEEGLVNVYRRKIIVDYKEFVSSNLEGMIFSKEQIQHLIKSEKWYGPIIFLNRRNAVSIFEKAIKIMKKRLYEINKTGEDMLDICLLLENQIKNLEAVRDSINKD